MLLIKYLLVASLFLFYSFGAFANQCNEDQSISALADQIVQRAALMKEVARIKHKENGRAATPYSADQEVKVLGASEQAATEFKISQDALMTFTQLQMDLSKQIQAYWLSVLATLPAGAVSAEHVTLVEIRAKIEKINKILYPAIKAAEPNIQYCTTKEIAGIIQKKFGQAKITNTVSLPTYFRLLAFSLKNMSS